MDSCDSLAYNKMSRIDWNSEREMRTVSASATYIVLAVHLIISSSSLLGLFRRRPEVTDGT